MKLNPPLQTFPLHFTIEKVFLNTFNEKKVSVLGFYSDFTCFLFLLVRIPLALEHF